MGYARLETDRWCRLSRNRQSKPDFRTMATLSITIDDVTLDRPLAGATLIGRAAWCTWIVDTPRIPATWLEFRWDGQGWQVSVLRDADQTELRGVRQSTSGWSSVRAGSEVRGPGVTILLVSDDAPTPFAVEIESGEIVSGIELERLVWCEGDEARSLDMPSHQEKIAPGGVFSAFGGRYRLHLGAPVPRAGRCTVDLLSPDLQLGFGATGGKYALAIRCGNAVETVRDRSVLAAVAYALARLDRVAVGGFIDADEAAARMVQYEGVQAGAYGPRYLRELRSRLSRCIADSGAANPGALFEVDPERGRLWRLRTRQIRFDG